VFGPSGSKGSEDSRGYFQEVLQVWK